MKNVVRGLLAVVVAFALGGCAANGVGSSAGLVARVEDDAKAANDLFIKYGDPAEAKCAAFFNDLIADQRSKSATLDALRAEETKGVISKAAVGILTAQILRSQGADAASKFRSGFQANCGEVQGEVLALIMSRGLSVK